MPFTTPDYTAIKSAILRDILNLLPEAATGDDSDYAVRASAVGAAIEGLYQYQQWLARQIIPDTAEGEFLERWAAIFGIARRAAATAAGTLSFAGTNGVVVPSGTEAKTAAGVAFVTTANGTISSGVVTVAGQAVVPGVTGNQNASTPLTLTSAPAGVSSAATITTMTGGTDIETDAALLDRLLARIQQPPQGGAAHDYIAWALEVSGVAFAYCYPQRRGIGTVDVVILPPTGTPSGGLIAATQAHIDARRPVTADCLVAGPTQVPVAVTASLTLSGTTLGAATTTITSLLVAYFATLKPGDTVYRTRLGALIAEVPGVLDYSLTAPAANVATLVDATHIELATLGTVTLS